MFNLKQPRTLLSLALFAACGVAAAAPLAPKVNPVRYRTVKIDGLDIFYREAGSPKKPTVLLLHGFPTSSQMFRNLLPKLADDYHVVAPDYPGYGNSSAPPVGKFDYSFDNFANVVDKFAQKLKLRRYSLYVMDYGAPVGYRLAVKHPERVQTLIVTGLTPGRHKILIELVNAAHQTLDYANVDFEVPVRSLVAPDTKADGFRAAPVSVG